jgi:hypothetical protein
MLKRQGKGGGGVKQAVKGLLSGVRKMVRPHEDEALVVGSSSSGSRQSQLLRHIEAECLSQRR